ncbi:uncharacterized protein LOC119580141 isoform X1 [Penaeus monodon]|uniref:uncharacterized protein LOC119580141 isoform X1 n=1 Tax=Penaeus monodon TaxID=6687 RepID=UPI0018A7DCF8|nr:uncharacterized protein LOC119580141 isoform X1 [Penaeus monodon]
MANYERIFTIFTVDSRNTTDKMLNNLSTFINQVELTPVLDAARSKKMTKKYLGVEAAAEEWCESQEELGLVTATTPVRFWILLVFSLMSWLHVSVGFLFSLFLFYFFFFVCLGVLFAVGENDVVRDEINQLFTDNRKVCCNSGYRRRNE